MLRCLYAWPERFRNHGRFGNRVGIDHHGQGSDKRRAIDNGQSARRLRGDHFLAAVVRTVRGIARHGAAAMHCLLVSGYGHAVCKLHQQKKACRDHQGCNLTKHQFRTLLETSVQVYKSQDASVNVPWTRRPSLKYASGKVKNLLTDRERLPRRATKNNFYACNLIQMSHLWENSQMARAMRRAQDQRMKSRARRTMHLWLGQRAQLDPRQVGVNASTHCRPCGCWMCQANRKAIPASRERVFDHPELP